MTAMRAVRVDRPGEIGLVELERPRPGPGEALMAVAAVGICGSDVELLDGTRPAPYVRYPVVPGHEWAGTVAEIGPGVAGLAPGDRVVAEGFRACERCDRCKEGRTNLCSAEYAETGFTHPGAFAEFVSVPARLVHRLPADADLEAAALLEPAACVAQGLLEVDARPGLHAAVVGSGTIGLLAVAMLRLVSPARLTLVGSRAERLALGRRLGATEVVDVNDDAAAGGLDGRFDLVFEAANRASGGALALRLARRGGTVVLEGISGSAEPSLTGDDVPLKHLRVQGVFGASGAAWRWVVSLFAAGLLDTRPLISHRYGLGEFTQAFATLRDRQAGALKVQLTP
ncbi:MAG TPA: alcohol dehydrogenase catalytic domain-containing protein [Candidatus Dormibacteraeota bacterium]|nr:alcohol dehydrogenase catalytic domain-containing protein [Candidatus Dormibacteraeota bacterium]